MNKSYLDRLEEEGVPMPETVEEVLRMKINTLEDVLAEVEYLSSSELRTSSRMQQADSWDDGKLTIRNLPVNERELTSLLVKMFDTGYYNAKEFLYDN